MRPVSPPSAHGGARGLGPRRGEDELHQVGRRAVAVPAPSQPSEQTSGPQVERAGQLFSSSEKKGSWSQPGGGGLEEGVLRERSEREGQEEKATLLEQSPKVRSALRVVIFAPSVPFPRSLGFAKPGLAGVRP